MNTRWHAIAAALLMGSPMAHAEIYKWVDEKGQTHYGERKPGAGSSGLSQVKIQPSATPPQPPAQPASSRPEKWFGATPRPSAKAPVPPAPKPRENLSDGRDHGTDASRCALARDILAGGLRHANGNPLDKNDIDTAKNDVRMFCKSR